MQYAIGRRGHCTVVLAIATAALLGSAAGWAATATPPELQLAQAAAPSAGTGEAAVTGQIADLRERLHITPAQQPQFEAFARVMQQNAEAMDALMRQTPPGSSGSALDELRAESRVADAEAQGLRRMLPAFQPLYEALSAEQKRAADELFAGPPPPSSH